MSESLRIGVVGAGLIAGRHVRAYTKAEDVEVGVPGRLAIWKAGENCFRQLCAPGQIAQPANENFVAGAPPFVELRCPLPLLPLLAGVRRELHTQFAGERSSVSGSPTSVAVVNLIIKSDR